MTQPLERTRISFGMTDEQRRALQRLKKAWKVTSHKKWGPGYNKLFNRLPVTKFGAI